MKEDLRFFKRFKEIEKGKENKGYLEWKDEVKSVLKKMDTRNLHNMQKRIYLSLKRSKKYEDGFVQINALMILSVTIVTALYNMVLDVFKQELMMATKVIEAFVIGGMIIILYFAVAMMRRVYMHDKRVDRELYYAELLKIIKRLLAERGECQH